jgi:hypothetical protein
MADFPVAARKGFGLDQSPNELVLGTFDRALTVFDQQVRALNLVFRLHENNCFAADKPIAVIGAGIAGMTFAAGSLWLGHRGSGRSSTRCACRCAARQRRHWRAAC